MDSKKLEVGIFKLLERRDILSSYKFQKTQLKISPNILKCISQSSSPPFNINMGAGELKALFGGALVLEKT